MRHGVSLKRGDRLLVFWMQVGHAPERVLLNEIALSAPLIEWKDTKSVDGLQPEHEQGGAGLPNEPSIRIVAREPVNQVWDPEIFKEDGRVYLLHAAVGESGITIAEIRIEN